MYIPKYFNRVFRPDTSGERFRSLRGPRSFPLPEAPTPKKYCKEFIVDVTDEIVQEEAKENLESRNKREEG